MKIAICYSGLTRNFNQDVRDKNVDFMNLVKSYIEQTTSAIPNVEIDWYGHTWEHCEEKPIETDTFKLKKYEATDQIEIWNWVKQNLPYRLPWKPSWASNFNFETSTDLEIIEFYKNIVPQCYGQIVGAFHAYNQVNTSDYDFVMRMRWDCQFAKWSDHQIKYDVSQKGLRKNDMARQLADTLIEIKLNKLYRWDASTFCTQNVGINCNPSDISVQPDDLFYLHDTTGNKSNWLSRNVYEVLDCWAKSHNVKWKGGRATSHTLWSEIFQTCNIIVSPMIQSEIVLICRNIDKDRKWDI